MNYVPKIKICVSASPDQSAGYFVCQSFNLKYSQEVEIPGNFCNGLLRSFVAFLKDICVPFSLGPSPAPSLL